MSCSCRLVQWREGLVHVQESPFQEADPALQGGAGISNDQESAPGAEIADLVTGAQHVTGRTTAGTARPRDIHQACAQMRPGAFKCKCKRRIKCKCKCKCSASESNANANAQQLNQMQMQMHLNQMQMHLNQMRINLYQMQTVFYKCVFCVQQVLIC